MALSQTRRPAPRLGQAAAPVSARSRSGLSGSFPERYSMRAQKQIAASRENGRKSHGAVTPEGKTRIVKANLWTGLFSETNVLTWEFQ